MFITAFKSVRHLSLSGANSIQSIPPHPTSWRSILISSSHLRLSLPSGLFASGFPTKTLYTPLTLPHARYVSRPSHSSRFWFYCITRKILGEQCRSLISSSCSFLHSPVTSSLRPSASYSQICSAYVPASVSATKFHTHTKQQTNLHFCISRSLYFLTANWETKYSAPNDSKHSVTSAYSYFPPE